jgi:hypothetical protein
MDKEPESNAWKKRKKMAKESLEKKRKEMAADRLDVAVLSFLYSAPSDGDKDKRLGPYHFDDIMRIMLEIFPEMELGKDLDGQLVVYTGWECTTSDGFYVPMKEESE